MSREITEISSGGVNQSGVRDHNERLILTVLQRRGATPGVDIARLTGLSTQTVSIILRKLEKDEILKRGAPIRGKVGKPSVPMELNPEGVLSLGMKIGRRSADLLLIDFTGKPRHQLTTTYDYPLPEEIFGFFKSGLEELLESETQKMQNRICGIGVGTPFEFWKWHGLDGLPAEKFSSWSKVDFKAEIAKFSDLPVFIANDATAACHAEHLFGRGAEYRDYFYFFIGSMIGGGITLNGTVFEGNQGNAGALGAIRTTGPLGESQQLIDVASLHLLENRLIESGLDPAILWETPQDWSGITHHVSPWIGTTAQELAKAALSICAVIDFQAIFIDGAFPLEIRDELVARVKRYLVNQDTRGLIPPVVEAGAVGENARGVGAASVPIFRQFLLNTNAGLSGI